MCTVKRLLLRLPTNQCIRSAVIQCLWHNTYIIIIWNFNTPCRGIGLLLLQNNIQWRDTANNHERKIKQMDAWYEWQVQYIICINTSTEGRWYIILCFDSQTTEANIMLFLSCLDIFSDARGMALVITSLGCWSVHYFGLDWLAMTFLYREANSWFLNNGWWVLSCTI